MPRTIFAFSARLVIALMVAGIQCSSRDMNDPCNQSDAQIDKALGQDWPDKSMNFRTASQTAQAGELMARAVKGQFVTRDETLAIYANEKNWRKEPHPDPKRGVMWVWQGPVICAPEAAQMVLDREKVGY